METKQIPTLYQWVGGMQRLEALFMRFYAGVPADPISGPVFGTMPADHFRIVAHFVGEVLGGPALYSGDGTTMVAKHLGRQPHNCRHVALPSADLGMTCVARTVDPKKSGVNSGYSVRT